MDRPTDFVIAELAARQHGRVSAWQLAALGVTPTQLRRRVASGRLHREHRGVYAVGHPAVPPDARRMGAVLASGPRALLSHDSLAHHLALLDGPEPVVIDVTVAGRARHGHPGLRLHLPRRLLGSEATVVRDVPCTTVERLIVDLAAGSSDAQLATVVHRARVRRLVHPAAMRTQLARPAAGVARVRELIEPAGPDLREKLERRFHAFIRAGGWRRYEPNVLLRSPLGTLRVDALWRELGFGLELDSWAHHGDRGAFETDRRKVLVADALGIDLKRVSWRMLTGTPEIVAALLDRRVGRPSASC